MTDRPRTSIAAPKPVTANAAALSLLWGPSESRGHGKAIWHAPSGTCPVIMNAALHPETSVVRACFARALHRLDFYPVRHPASAGAATPIPFAAGAALRGAGPFSTNDIFQPRISQRSDYDYTRSGPVAAKMFEWGIFYSRKEAQMAVENWRVCYNCASEHSSFYVI